MASLPPKPPPPANSLPLAPGWTEHKAPTGHSYYYNASTKTSTYSRPVAPPVAPRYPAPRLSIGPPPPLQAGPYPRPYVPYAQPFPPPGGHQLPHRPYFQDVRGAPRGGPRGQGFPPRGHGLPPKPKLKPQDGPKKKRAIPGAEPWVLVTTKMGRTFVHNIETRASLWTAPKEVQEKIDVMPPVDQEQERRERRERRARKAAEKVEKERVEKERLRALMPAKVEEGEPSAKKVRTDEAAGPADEVMKEAQAEEEHDEAEAEEEKEGEEEEEEESDEEHQQPPPNQAQEFTEEDIAWQLEAMAEEYGLGEEDFEEGEELAPEDTIALFRQLLDDQGISPYSTWDDALPKLVDDNRYTVLSTTKARKEVFTDWCKERAAQLREEKERAGKINPKIPFWAFLKEHTTSKLFWAEFKRKWRKEPVMKDTKLSDKEREKMYRDFVARNKTSESIREVDLKKLLKSTPSLTRNTALHMLPDSVLADARYVTAPESSRDSIITEFLASLPEVVLTEEERKANEERERRGKALREREWAVRQEKRRNAADEAMAKQLLRDEEAVIERAKIVGKKGLLGHLRKEEAKEETPAPTAMEEV
ncbi:hypothetical protein BZA05DRAFT_374931 [Tricharina praecox]|uniref:uncharacterized protein n=1 Tax=Tricharina praecox TaxID=43433 RepID=UPI00221E6034|nr:uncharacterized protein BZA05DRAFT_374931 [Tricharina praecox]KAI5849753.1 hypothetical protein BZA05DRAFT_374931 [Tricharina praecox]